MSRRRVKWYTDFGGIDLPVLPQFCILTDRADGTLWFISHASNGLHLSINDATVFNKPSRTFAAFDEPYVPQDPRMRIFVRGGRIGYEIRELPQGVGDRDQMRIVSNRPDDEVVKLEVIQPANFNINNVGLLGVLAWEDSVV